MSPILGIWASGISGSKAVTTNFISLQTATVDSGGATEFTFSSIPQTYTHLQLRGVFLHDTNYVDLYAQFNGDTNSNYNAHYLMGDGSSASAVGLGSRINIPYFGSGSTASSNRGCAFVVDILDYTNTNKYKVSRSLTGEDANGAGVVALESGLWRSTSAITSIKIYLVAGNFYQYSTFALYGVK